MVLSASLILILVALVLTVVSFIDNRYPLLSVAVLLLCVALLVR
jgi:hypothetical protein